MEGLITPLYYKLTNFQYMIYRGGWDTEGVTVITNDMKNSIIICNSSHLTSFAVLVDVSGGHQVFYIRS